MVFIGATVLLKDLDTEEEDEYKLVGNPSGNFSLDFIEVSSVSPMGVALMKSRVGETIRVDLPKGTKRFEIVKLID